jgi:chromosome segregation ATPase
MSDDQKRIGFLQKAIAKGEELVGKLKAKEQKSRERWTKGYHRFLAAADKLADVKDLTTKKVAELKKVIKSWPQDTVKLTEERDKFREEIRNQETVLHQQRTELAVLEERLRNLVAKDDEIIKQVFERNAASVTAQQARNEYLMNNVFTRLFDETGKLKSQITITSSDGLSRVRAMTNDINRLDTNLADEANAEIDKFFARFTLKSDTEDASSETVIALTALLKNVLIEKVKYKPGQDLWRFMSVEIPDLFPELKKAQLLLRSSLRSEKTSPYARLYVRASRKDKWVQVNQS